MIWTRQTGKGETMKDNGPVSERDRWINVRFAACAIAGNTEDEELHFLRALHDHWFRDVPDRGDVSDPAIAVKLLLWALIENRVNPERMRKIADAMTPHVARVVFEQ
jgi:hypothetical protein